MGATEQTHFYFLMICLLLMSGSLSYNLHKVKSPLLSVSFDKHMESCSCQLRYNQFPHLQKSPPAPCTLSSSLSPQPLATAFLPSVLWFYKFCIF